MSDDGRLLRGPRAPNSYLAALESESDCSIADTTPDCVAAGDAPELHVGASWHVRRSSKFLRPSPAAPSPFVTKLYRLAWGYASTSASASLPGQGPDDQILVAAAVRGASSVVPLSDGTGSAEAILADPLAIRWLRDRLRSEPPTEGGLATVVDVLEAMAADADIVPEPATAEASDVAGHGSGCRMLSNWRLRLCYRLLGFLHECVAAGPVACGPSLEESVVRSLAALRPLMQGRSQRLAMHKDGTRMVQDSLRLAASVAAEAAMPARSAPEDSAGPESASGKAGALLCATVGDELKAAVAALSAHKHANYALQAVVQWCQPAQRGAVVAWALSDVVDAACGEYSCRLVQRLLEHCGAGEVEALRLALARSASIVLGNYWGRFVVQLLVMQCKAVLTAAPGRTAPDLCEATARARHIAAEGTPAGRGQRPSDTAAATASAKAADVAQPPNHPASSADDSPVAGVMPWAVAERCLNLVATSLRPSLAECCRRNSDAVIVGLLLDASIPSTVNLLAPSLVALAPALSCERVGNFVIQRFLHVARGPVRHNLVAALQAHAPAIAASQFGRHVLKELQVAEASAQQAVPPHARKAAVAGVHVGSFAIPATVFAAPAAPVAPATSSAAPRLTEPHTRPERSALAPQSLAGPWAESLLAAHQAHEQSTAAESAAGRKVGNGAPTAGRQRCLSDDPSPMLADGLGRPEEHQTAVSPLRTTQSASQGRPNSSARCTSNRHAFEARAARAAEAAASALADVEGVAASPPRRLSGSASPPLGVIDEACGSDDGALAQSCVQASRYRSRSAVSEILYRSHTSMLYSGSASIASAATAHGALGSRATRWEAPRAHAEVVGTVGPDRTHALSLDRMRPVDERSAIAEQLEELPGIRRQQQRGASPPSGESSPRAASTRSASLSIGSDAGGRRTGSGARHGRQGSHEHAFLEGARATGQTALAGPATWAASTGDSRGSSVVVVSEACAGGGGRAVEVQLPHSPMVARAIHRGGAVAQATGGQRPLDPSGLPQSGGAEA